MKVSKDKVTISKAELNLEKMDKDFIFLLV